MSRLIDENFEGTGYEELWTETVDAGCTLDEDAVTPIDGLLPPGGILQCLKATALDATFANAYALRTLASSAPIAYVRGYLLLAQKGFGVNKGLNTLKILTLVGNTVAHVQLYQSGTELKMRFQYYSNGSIQSTTGGNISLGTWYRIEFLYDETNLLWQWKIDGISQDNGVLVAETRTPRRLTAGINKHTGASSSILFTDLVALDNSEWPGKKSGKLLDENFEGTGTEEEWLLNPAAGCIVDVDSAIPGTPPPSSGSQCCACTVVGDKASGQNYARIWRYLQPETEDVIYVHGYIYVHTNGISVGNRANFLNGLRTDYTHNVEVWLYNDAGQLKLLLRYYNNGGYSFSLAKNVNTEAWYKIEYKYDRTNFQWSFEVDGSLIDSGALVGVLGAGISRIQATIGNDYDDNATTIIYFDQIRVHAASEIPPIVAVPLQNQITDQFDGDVAYVLTPDGGQIFYTGGQPIMDVGGLENAVNISLFTDLGYWANALNENEPDKQVGSDFEERVRPKAITTAHLRDVEDAARDALQWMINQKIAQTIEANAVWPELNQIELALLITKPGGEVVKIRHELNWEGGVLFPVTAKVEGA